MQPGTGFETHPHRDMEIVTWVLQGSLVHQDSDGHTGVIYPGLAQRMSAGTGILHSREERLLAAAGGEQHTDPVHFVQMWVVPDEAGITPGYEQLEIDHELLSGGLVPVASGMAGARRRRGHPDQEPLRRAPCRPAPARPERAAARGAVPAPVRAPRGASPSKAPARCYGDAVRFTATGGQRVTATEPAEILVWEMHADPRLTTPVTAVARTESPRR